MTATPPTGTDTGETLALVRPATRAQDSTRAPGAVVLLAGAVRESTLAKGTRRPLLDLPLTVTTTVAGMWIQRISELSQSLSDAAIPLIIATTPGTPDAPAVEPSPLPGAVFVPDSSPLRGTGGALVDLCSRFKPSETILVANAHAVALRPLAPIVRSLLEADADVVLHADENSAPTGIFLARVEALLDIPRRGFVDFKEQALARIASSHLVRVVRQPGPHVTPVRTLDGYIRAVRYFASTDQTRQLNDPLAEEWRSTFTLVDPGARVAPDARLVDSVILPGASVGARAVVVRSLVCPGAEVPADGYVCDQVIDPAGEVS